MAASAALIASACTSRIYTSGYGDDLYSVHDRSQLMAEELRQREYELAQREARIAAREIAMEDISYDNGSAGYGGGILSDNFADSYERRLRGFNSASNNMPSSYIEAEANGKIRYASAYDPAYYNVIVMGDEVWVEPKYISSMFGYTGASRINVNIGFGSWWGWPYYPSSLYMWNTPYYSWNWRPYGVGYWGGYYDPWYNWRWDNYYYGWGGWGHYPHHNWYSGGGYHSYRPNRFGASHTIYGRPRVSSGGGSGTSYATSVRRSAPASSSVGGTVVGRPGVSNTTGAVRRSGSYGISSGIGSSGISGSVNSSGVVRRGVSTSVSGSTVTRPGSTISNGSAGSGAVRRSATNAGSTSSSSVRSSSSSSSSFSGGSRSSGSSISSGSSRSSGSSGGGFSGGGSSGGGGSTGGGRR